MNILDKVVFALLIDFRNECKPQSHKYLQSAVD